MARVCDNCGTRDTVSARNVKQSISDGPFFTAGASIDLDDECYALLCNGDFLGLRKRAESG